MFVLRGFFGKQEGGESDSWLQSSESTAFPKAEAEPTEEAADRVSGCTVASIDATLVHSSMPEIKSPEGAPKKVHIYLSGNLNSQRQHQCLCTQDSWRGYVSSPCGCVAVTKYTDLQLLHSLFVFSSVYIFPALNFQQSLDPAFHKIFVLACPKSMTLWGNLGNLCLPIFQLALKCFQQHALQRTHGWHVCMVERKQQARIADHR